MTPKATAGAPDTSRPRLLLRTVLKPYSSSSCPARHRRTVQFTGFVSDNWRPNSRPVCPAHKIVYGRILPAGVNREHAALVVGSIPTCCTVEVAVIIDNQTSTVTSSRRR